jgi:hypothetical protein
VRPRANTTNPSQLTGYAARRLLWTLRRHRARAP